MKFFGSSSPPPEAGLPASLTEAAPKSWDPDAAAERILFDRFWSSAGWKAERHTEPAQSEYAQAAGYLFGHATLHHDGVVERLVTLRDELSPEDVGTAFADSLATNTNTGTGYYEYGYEYGDWISCPRFSAVHRSATAR